MDGQARLEDKVEELNRLLGEITPYRLAVVDPGEVRLVDKNARYMSKRVYDQLAANIRRDGNLSSLPFCWRRPDGSLVALSGNHRVQAARDAGVERVLILYTDQELSRGQQVAIQLSHNALVGEDNPATLRELWNEIDTLEAKIYSGLDDELLETIAPVAVVRLDEEQLRMEELSLFFMPAEVERVEDVLGRLGKAAKARLAARLEDFDRFFETLLQFKEAADILNTSTAILAMTEIVEAWLAERNEVEHELEE